MQLSVPAWIAKITTWKFGQRIMFTLLAIWVHFAAFFFLATILFFGKHSGGVGKPHTNPASEHTVEISLIGETQPLPEYSSGQLTADTATDTLEHGATPSSQSTQAIIAPHIEEVLSHADDNSDQDVPNGGILGCESLTKKPQRMTMGDDYVQIMPDTNPTGHLVLHEVISREGVVISVTVEDSTVNKQMESQIIARAYRSVYRPGEIGGIAVDCEAKFMVSPTPTAP